MNSGLTDIFPASAQSVEVDQDKANHRQRQGGESKAKSEMIGQLEQRQYHGPEYLIEQSAQDNPQCQGAAPHCQIFQKEQPGHLLILKAGEQIGSQFPAPAQEHELCGIGCQPAKHTHHYDGGHGNHQRKHIHPPGQCSDLSGKGQGVKGVEQGGGHNYRDKVDQVVFCLSSGISEGKLK